MANYGKYYITVRLLLLMKPMPDETVFCWEAHHADFSGDDVLLVVL